MYSLLFIKAERFLFFSQYSNAILYSPSFMLTSASFSMILCFNDMLVTLWRRYPKAANHSTGARTAFWITEQCVRLYPGYFKYDPAVDAPWLCPRFETFFHISSKRKSTFCFEAFSRLDWRWYCRHQFAWYQSFYGLSYLVFQWKWRDDNKSGTRQAAQVLFSAIVL